MAEKAGVHAKAQEPKQKCSNFCSRKFGYNPSGYSADRVLQLQRTAGNQAVQRLVKSRALQAKLKVGQPDDIYEQEADRVAEQVMSIPEPQAASSGTLPIQRTCSNCEEKELRRQPIKEEEENKELLQTREISGHSAETISDLESSINAIRGGGQPLPESVRAFFEPRFGHDFSQVRMHTDAKAAESARAINAQAYTIGKDVVFGPEQYISGTSKGNRLLAHELTHVVQQTSENKISSGQNDKKRGMSFFPNRATQIFYPLVAPAQQVARQAAPAFSPPCSGGATDPCRLARCSPGEQTTILADLSRGLGYVSASIKALAATPLSGFTTRAMDWYFGGHDVATVTTVSTRLGCISTSLTSASGKFGCHPNHDSLAYTCAGGAGFCGHLATDICFTRSHFGKNPKERSITAIHEAAHLEGMSTGSASTNPDIYEHQMRFLDISPSHAVQNADSYALFTAAIGTNSIPSTILIILGAGGGLAFTSVADPTWYFQGTLGLEYQHPRLRIFNPTLNFGLTLIGEAENQETGVRASESTLTSLLFGLRIGRARRPGAGGAMELSLFGGPAISWRTGSDPQIGTVAGIAVGYRWRILDVSFGAGYAYDPKRSEAGLEHTATVGGTFNINF
jgi:hypothetical protein